MFYSTHGMWNDKSLLQLTRGCIMAHVPKFPEL